MKGRFFIAWSGVLITLALAHVAVAQTVYPSADGTLVDGGGFGAFDGVADQADWSFNQSSYEGSIALTATLEQRVIWEFNLSPVMAVPPVTATLAFTLRGAPRFPAEPAPVQVYVYPSDLLETLADFAAGPANLVAEQAIEPFQPPTVYLVNVSSLVSERLASPTRRIAFRFQIDPQADAEPVQAFIDALDSDKTTKPYLTITARMPGDFDNDHDVDLDDYAQFAECMHGPGAPVPLSCRVFDENLDGDVDLVDLVAFLDHLTNWGN